jgi:hypothetical protein
MATAAKTTTDHDEIRRWTEAHGGHPAAVKGTGAKGDPGMLRLDFPGFSGERTLKPISWDDFFKWFDVNELALLYRPQDRFNKLVSRSTARARAKGERPRRRTEKQGRTGQERKAATRKRIEGRRRKAGTKASGTSKTTKRPRARA